MKRISKIFAILVTALLVFSLLGVFALAEDATPAAAEAKKEAISEGKFLFYDSSAKTFTEYSNSNFKSKLQSLNDGDAIVLLSDLHSEDCYLKPSVAGTAYIDFNGYRFSAHYDHSTRYYLQPQENTTLYMYSSDDTYKTRIFCAATNQSNGQETSMVFINPRLSNTHIYLGDATGAPVFEKSGSSWTLKSNTGNYDGDNIEFYGSTLFSSYISGNKPQNSTFNIGGGSYYNVQNGGTLIQNYTGIDISVDEASFFAPSGGNFLTFHSASADANVTVKDTLIYTSGAAIDAIYETKENASTGIKTSNTLFENCSFISQTIVNSVKSGSPEFRNCRYSNAVYNDGINDLVRTNEKQTITVKSASFERDVTSTTKTTENEDGTTTTKITYTGTLLDSSFEISETVLPVTYIQRGVKNGEFVDVTWVALGEETTEKWYKGADVYPVSTVIPTPTDVYAYDYYPAIKPTAETGNITYTLKPHINFTLRANIALYADFTYNLYIPESAADSELFNWARIDSLTESGAIYETGAVNTVKGGKVANLEVAKDVFEKNYVLTQDISAFEGDTEYQLVINVDDGFGGTFEHIQRFSIFDYADRVNEGNYTAEAKDLVNYTKAYIKAACNYATEEGALPYPTESNDDLAAVLGTASSAEKATPSDEVRKVFYGMNLSLDESIKFSFYLHPGFTDTVTFHYPVNTKYTSVTISAADCTSDDTFGENLLRYDISMRAIDLRGRIVIDISSTPDIEEDYSYRLSNYVHSIKDQPETTRLLVDSLWAYSLASYNYLKVADSDSPTVTVSVAGNQVTADSYVIVASDPNGKAAIALRDAILGKTGEKLAISSNEVDGKKSIYVNLTDPNRTYDFIAYVDGENLVINCGFASFIDGATASFIEKNINSKSKDIKFDAGFRDDYYTSNIYYSDFGAYGVDMDAAKTLGYENIENWYGDTLESLRENGILVNEFSQIRDAHLYANTTQRHTVCAEDDAVYYIRESLIDGSVKDINIQTPTNWGNANFLLDDTFIPGTKTDENATLYSQRAHLFSIASNHSMFTVTDATLLAKVTAAGIKPGTKVIDLGLGYPAMIIPYNNTHNVYRRHGESSGQAGSAMHEVILIDENGNVSSSTPIMFDYTTVSKIEVHRSDVAPITVEGGTFTTIVPRDETVTYQGSGAYISRGMSIARSNATVKDVKHHIIGEYLYTKAPVAGDPGVCPYQGFFTGSNAANILIEDCVFQAKRYYRIAGTYDFSANAVAGITLKNCTQRNFWVDYEGRPANQTDEGAMTSMTGSRCWGLGGTNFCKNVAYVGSTLSRFDAHAGLYNGKIVDSTINGVELTGNGDMLFDNVIWYNHGLGATGNSLIALRNDYGCTWDGTITIKDVKMYHYENDTYNYEKGNAAPGALIYHNYKNWYFGYDAHFPNIVIDNIEYYSIRTGKLLTAKERGAVDFAVRTISATSTSSSFITEPNLHLANTSVTPPIYYNVDNVGAKDEDGKDIGDGIIDGTNFAYNASNGKYYTHTGARNNLNPIVPPEFIKIINNKQDYDFTSKIEYYKTKTTFFDNTKIIIIKDGESPDKIRDEDSPIIPFN